MEEEGQQDEQEMEEEKVDSEDELINAEEEKHKDQPQHNNSYSSGNYFKLKDCTIMIVDYRKDTYFPENGPYRCQICKTIVQTNIQFYGHVTAMHSGKADKMTENSGRATEYVNDEYPWVNPYFNLSS
jgi:hypothetical protein